MAQAPTGSYIEHHVENSQYELDFITNMHNSSFGMGEDQRSHNRSRASEQ